jgi:hypothetical protein
MLLWYERGDREEERGEERGGRRGEERGEERRGEKRERDLKELLVEEWQQATVDATI